MHAKVLGAGIGDTSAIPEPKEFVSAVGELEIRFDIPQQTRWNAVLALIFTPLIIELVGFLK